MERFVIARTDKGGEGGTVTFATLGQDGRGRWRHVAARSRRKRWRPDAVRLPDGYLPNLRLPVGIEGTFATSVGNRARRGRPDSDADFRSVRGLHHQRLGGMRWLSPISRNTPHLHRGRRRAAGARTRCDKGRYRRIQGERDARYVRRAIQFQRAMAAGGRIALFASRNKYAWATGTAMLGVAKIVENMELGHNITHGQWDWMNDRRSTPPSGSGTPPRPACTGRNRTTSCTTSTPTSSGSMTTSATACCGSPETSVGTSKLGNPSSTCSRNTFEWGVALHGVEISKVRRGEKSWAEVRKDLRVIGKKVGKQAGKDYVVFPALTGRAGSIPWPRTRPPNIIRNYWSYAVIFCGHFPDGAEKFTRESIENETQPSGTCDRCWGQPTSTPAG